MPRKSTSQRQKTVNREIAAEDRGVRRTQITTVDGARHTVYAVGGETGVFAASCEPDRRGTICLYSGDDGTWRYLTSIHTDWLKRVQYCLDLAAH